VLAPAGTTTSGSSASRTYTKDKNTITNNGIVTNRNSQWLVRYNGPDLEQNTTDYDGMETVATRQQRQQARHVSESKLVMYTPPPTPPTPDNNTNHNNDPTNHHKKQKQNQQEQQQQQQHRPTLTQDIKYSIQYIEKTDFTMARKTGLAVNKPISLWIERDTFLDSV